MLDSITNNWDYPVEMQPIFSDTGKKIETHRAVVRTDTSEVLGVHGNSYKIITNDDVINSIMDSIKKTGLGTDYKFKAIVTDNGRKMRAEIIYPNEAFEPVVGDIHQFRINVYNSYDGSWAMQQVSDALRLRCLNGQMFPDVISKTWAKHTTNVSIDGSALKIVKGLNTFKNQKEIYQGYMKAKVDRTSVEAFLKMTLCSVKMKSDAKKYNEKRLESLLGLYDTEASNLGSNKWALYNSLTYWATHTGKLKSPENARRIRENEIAKAIPAMAMI